MICSLRVTNPPFFLCLEHLFCLGMVLFNVNFDARCSILDARWIPCEGRYCEFYWIDFFHALGMQSHGWLFYTSSSFSFHSSSWRTFFGTYSSTVGYGWHLSFCQCGHIVDGSFSISTEHFLSLITSSHYTGDDINNDADGESAASLPALTTIWDCTKIKRRVGNSGLYWQCFHCNTVPFSGANATKAMHHVLKTQGQNIRLCQAEIPFLYLRLCEELHAKANNNKTSKIDVAFRRAKLLVDRLDRVTSTNRSKRRQSISPAPLLEIGLKTVVSSSDTPSSLTLMSTVPGTISSSSMAVPNKKPRMKQSYVHTRALDLIAERKLDVCIADLIHGNSFPLHIERYVIH